MTVSALRTAIESARPARERKGCCVNPVPRKCHVEFATDVKSYTTLVHIGGAAAAIWHFDENVAVVAKPYIIEHSYLKALFRATKRRDSSRLPMGDDLMAQSGKQQHTNRRNVSHDSMKSCASHAANHGRVKEPPQHTRACAMEDKQIGEARLAHTHLLLVKLAPTRQARPRPETTRYRRPTRC